MDHWFDRLAQPHTRRTTLKATLLAGAALVLPLGRVPPAEAFAPEPCFKACLDEVKVTHDSAYQRCNHAGHVGAARGYVSLLSGLGPAAVIGLVTVSRALGCLADADVAAEQAFRECRQPQCGDPGKFPGGNPPGNLPKCTPELEIQCGDICCNATGHPDCCQCPKTGMFMCCASGKNCDCCG